MMHSQKSPHLKPFTIVSVFINLAFSGFLVWTIDKNASKSMHFETKMHYYYFFKCINFSVDGSLVFFQIFCLSGLMTLQTAGIYCYLVVSFWMDACICQEAGI